MPFLTLLFGCYSLLYCWELSVVEVAGLVESAPFDCYSLCLSFDGLYYDNFNCFLNAAYYYLCRIWRWKLCACITAAPFRVIV